MSLGASVGLLAASQSGSPSESQASVAGTYSLIFCRDGCGNWDTTRAYLTGTVVLFDSTLKDPDRKPIAELVGFANGCFRNRVLKNEFPSHAAIRLSGFLSWKQSDTTGQVAMHLFRSADAAYSVTALLGPQGGKGMGTWWMNGATDSNPDSVLLRRTGEADPAFCGTTGRTHRGPAMLKGTVVSEPYAAALPGALVVIESRASKQIRLADSSGNFMVASLDPATYTVTARALGYPPLTRTVRLEPGDTSSVTLIVELHCRFDSALAVRDIAAGRPRILLHGGIAPFAYNEQDRSVERRFHFRYLEFGDQVMNPLECDREYNRVIFRFLDGKYGAAWRAAVRTSP
jgi:hypothetical protein